MKKKLVLLLSVVLVICGLLCSCGKRDKQSAEFNSTVKISDFEVVIDDNILTATQLNGDQDLGEKFLTTDYTRYGGLCNTNIVAEDGYVMAVVSYNVKNVGQKEDTFKEKIKLDYNNGYVYEYGDQYYTNGDDVLSDWSLCESITMQPLTTVFFKTCFYVPEEVMTNNDAPLKLIMGNYEFSIR